MRIRPRTASLAATALLTSLVVALALGPSESAGADPVAPQPATIRVGSYNIKDSLSDARAAASLDAFLPSVDVAGLQEWGGPGRSTAVRDLVGWSRFRPPQGGPLVLWRSDDFSLVRAYGTLLAAGRRVERVGSARRVLPDNRATVVVLRHLATGLTIVLVDLHAPTNVDDHGRPWPTRPLRERMYGQVTAAAASVVRTERAEGQVFLVGDVNVGYRRDAQNLTRRFPVARFGGVGLRSQWTGAQVSDGTLGGRLVDGVWAGTLPSAPTVLSDVGYSDHKPAVATYQVR